MNLVVLYVLIRVIQNCNSMNDAINEFIILYFCSIKLERMSVLLELLVNQAHHGI